MSRTKRVEPQHWSSLFIIRFIQVNSTKLIICESSVDWNVLQAWTILRRIVGMFSRLQRSCHKDLQMQIWQSFHPLRIKNLLNIYADFVILTHCPWTLKKFSHQRIIIWKTTTTEQKYNFLNAALPLVPDYFAHLLSLWNKRTTPYFVMMQCEHGMWSHGCPSTG